MKSPSSFRPHNYGPISAMEIIIDSAPRPCRTTGRDTEDNDPRTRPMKTKRVVFADDKGLELTQVKIMTEPSNEPPHWTLQLLTEATRGFVVDFKQPASDYLEFRQILEERKVSLENVIVRESESILVGTVKVRNLNFDKEVIVRVTYDQWKSQEDILCTYSSVTGGGAYPPYDTFSFKFTLPGESQLSVQFCVCFRCNGQEYWDSNKGLNYTLSRRIKCSSGESNSILTNSNSSMPSLNYQSSWRSGTLSDSEQPYW